MHKLIMMRHGQSMWNKENFFTGWVDVPLSPEGIDEAIRGGQEIAHIAIDMIFTSTLVRGVMTAMIAMAQHDTGKVPVVVHGGEGREEEWSQIYNESSRVATVPVIRAWQLNERYYGELQGLNKDETRARYGVEQVEIWRRSFDTAPPSGESLKMTSERTIPYFKERVVPHLEEGNVFISAHGNSLRSIVMDLESLSPDEVVRLEIPTGVPIVYDYADGTFTKSGL